MEEEIDLREIFEIIKRTKWLFVFIAIFNIIILALYMLFAVTPQYATSTKVLIDSSDTSIPDFLPDRDVINQVSDELDMDYDNALSEIKTSFDSTKKVITITVTGDSADKVTSVLDKYQELLKPELNKIYNTKKYDTIVNADTPKSTYPSRLKKGLLIDVGISVFVYALYIMFLINKSKGNVDSIIEKNSVNVLGQIEEEDTYYRKDLWITDNRNQIENFNRIMVNIELNRKLLRPKTILVTDLNSNNEACYVAMNLAVAYANLKKKVLIINTIPSLKIPGDVFSTVEIEAGSIEMMMADGMQLDNVDVMSKEAENMIENLKKVKDIIIIIGETIISKVNAIAWAHIVDATILTQREVKFDEENLLKAKEYVEKVDGRLSGIVITEDEEKIKAKSKTKVTKKKNKHR